jgi:malate dehydrogenase (oxaloacetate-decarboxylating)
MPLVFSVASTARLTTVPLPQIWVTTTLTQPVCPAPRCGNQVATAQAQTSSWITASGRRDGVRALWRDEGGAWRTTLRGRQVLADPRINKGTAFSGSERRGLGLTGLIPAAHFTLDDQVARVYAQYQRQPDDLARNVTLTALHDRNEVLFYRLLTDHLSEMLPIVYTPTVGQAIERYSHEYRRPRGIYLSVDHPELIDASLLACDLGPGDVDLIVATDAGAILGIGDWGVGGIDIAVGKLAVYTAAGGIDPARAIPVMLDVGTDRQSLLDDPLYIGNRHPRVPTAEYDAFLDEFVGAVGKLFPLALLHWEDLGVANAGRLLQRYRDERLTFNDDIQGTGAVNLAAVLGATRATGVPLTGHRIVIFGMGTAGTGIADQVTAAMVAGGVPEAEARRRFWAVDRQGLLTRDMAALSDQQRRYARDPAEVAGWRRDGRPAGHAVLGDQTRPGSPGGIGLAEVVARVHPTVLIGTSTRAGAFTEAIARDMAAHAERPVILPMSNPTALSEATPADLIKWTDGRALVATGSPFGAVDHGSIRYEIGQANNALLFPGLGLGVIASRARRVTNGMLLAAASAVADLVDISTPGGPLLPLVADLRETSVAVAAVVARAAEMEGVASAALDADLTGQVRALMWEPRYRPIKPA